MNRNFIFLSGKIISTWRKLEISDTRKTWRCKDKLLVRLCILSDFEKLVHLCILSVFSPNAGKYGPDNSETDTFHAVYSCYFLIFWLLSSSKKLIWRSNHSEMFNEIYSLETLPKSIGKWLYRSTIK